MLKIPWILYWVLFSPLSTLFPETSSAYTPLPIAQSQSFEQLYVHDYFSVSGPDLPLELHILMALCLSDQLHLNDWRGISTQSLLTSAFPQCPPPMSPAHFHHLPSWSRKSLGSHLDSSFSSPLYTQVLWIPSPKVSGSVLCLCVHCKNLPSKPITSCLHSHNSLPILPLPICFPRCSLYDLVKTQLV